MITEKNEGFLARYGSQDTTEKIWKKYGSDVKTRNYMQEHNVSQNPFLTSSTADELAEIYVDNVKHPAVSKEFFDKTVNSGYGRQSILKSPNLTAEHIKTMEKKRPLTGSDLYQIARNPSIKSDVIEHVLFHGPKVGDVHVYHGITMDANDIGAFGKNKNLQPHHISKLIEIGKKKNESPSITFGNLARHPNLSKENEAELRNVNHAYINKLLDERK